MSGGLFDTESQKNIELRNRFVFTAAASGEQQIRQVSLRGTRFSAWLPMQNMVSA